MNEEIEWKCLRDVQGFEMFPHDEVSSTGIVRRKTTQKECKRILCKRTGLYRVRLTMRTGYKQPTIESIVRAAFDKDFTPILSKEAYSANRFVEAVFNSEFTSKKELETALKNELATIRGMK